MQSLTASCGTPFFVDDDTYEWAQHVHWYLKKGYPCHYICSTRYGQRDNFEAFLHRELMHFPIGDVHHKDENPLNCQMDNLEILSRAVHRERHHQSEQTATHRRAAGPRSASGFKGVSFHRRFNKWIAQIRVNGHSQTLGYTHTAEEAALLYDAAVIAFIPGSYTNLIPG